ncbi:hypothetical protein H1R20_g12132, partial [Candolleomyces eurysporus]
MLSLVCKNIMSDDDDDYLSAKYLVDATPAPASKTYSQIRKDAQKRSEIRHAQSQRKSRKEIEREAREAGLSKSLFERAKEEEEAGLGSGNKALAMMMKMGFKPGQSLGKQGEDDDNRLPGSSSSFGIPRIGRTANAHEQRRSISPVATTTASKEDVEPGDDGQREPHTKHRTVPLPIGEWAGKQGIGLGKRARSPSASERLAKIAKMAEDSEHKDFRSRARDEYNNRRAEGRLGPAQRTCVTLDEESGKEFNVLWLNPTNENTFPPGLIDALTSHSNLLLGLINPRQGDPSTIRETEAQRLRAQMQADALQPLDDEQDAGSSTRTKATPVSAVDQYSSDILEEATQFLRLQVG